MANKTKGQTALVLILLTAAALIFLAITMNWGRIAQTKTLLTNAAYGGASMMASDPASYGEMQKQTYLKDQNKLTESTGILTAVLTVILAIVAVIIAIPTGGFSLFLASLSLAFAVTNLVLQAVVVQPGITHLWNSLQKNQPQTEQFYEQAVSTALQGAVTDSATINDYLDWNANGWFGVDSTSQQPKDTVGRFAVFYTDRLKMMVTPISPQVQFFYNQLSEFVNGENCFQNETDAKAYPGIITEQPYCLQLDQSKGQPDYCINNPTVAQCTQKIPGGFQLSDGCSAEMATVGNPAYTPYCDPCCQPLSKTNGLGQTVPQRPSTCDQSALPPQCYTNNPFNSTPTATDSPYPLLYDPTFQNYNDTTAQSFLSQLGRDQQRAPFNGLNPDGSAANGLYFPNGMYTFLWLANMYSLQTDNITSTPPASSSEYHWCAASGGTPAAASPSSYADLNQLALPYACQGVDCCVNYLPNTLVSGVPAPSATPNGPMDVVGDSANGGNPSTSASFGTGGSSQWAPGDNQTCAANWPYNGSPDNYPADGTCEWTTASTCDSSGNCTQPTCSPTPTGNCTVDSVDGAVHSLSGLLAFAQGILSQDVGTLSSTVSTWAPSVTDWASTNSSLPANFSAWSSAINALLSQDFSNNASGKNPWCLPAANAPAWQVNGANTSEYNYISGNGGTWGSLSSVIACLNYNAGETPTFNPPNSSTYTETQLNNNGALYNFQQCQTAVHTACSAGLFNSGAVCDPAILGRSLAGPNPGPSCSAAFTAWVDNNVTLVQDEAPKFALRAAYLQDIYNKISSLPGELTLASQQLTNFMAPCAGSNCQDGGPAAQLAYAASQPPASAAFPNSVIYGWKDPDPGPCTDPSGVNKVGCAHLVRVTAYSPGRGGDQTVLPWIKTSTKSFLGIPYQRTYQLTNRNGQVYVGVTRWDEDHTPMLFPNGRQMWQSLFHAPGGTTTTGQGLMAACLPGSGVGFGLMPNTINGLTAQNMTSTDKQTLGSAFMLNDGGDGTIDQYDHNQDGGGYQACLQTAENLLAEGMESHACALYMASSNANECNSGNITSDECSGDGDQDYSLKFISCPKAADSF